MRGKILSAILIMSFSASNVCFSGQDIHQLTLKILTDQTEEKNSLSRSYGYAVHNPSSIEDVTDTKPWQFDVQHTNLAAQVQNLLSSQRRFDDTRQHFAVQKNSLEGEIEMLANVRILFDAASRILRRQIEEIEEMDRLLGEPEEKLNNSFVGNHEKTKDKGGSEKSSNDLCLNDCLSLNYLSIDDSTSNNISVQKPICAD